MQVKIGRSIWRVRHRAPEPGWDGETDYAEKEISIRPSLRGKRLLQTILHESLHPSTGLSHRAIERVSSIQAQVLWGLGWRAVRKRG